MSFDKAKNQRRQFAFVTFEREVSVELVCREPKQNIGNKECDIKKATSKPGARGMRGGWAGGFGAAGGLGGRGGRGGRGRGGGFQNQGWGNQGYGGGGYGGGGYDQGYGGDYGQGHGGEHSRTQSRVGAARERERESSSSSFSSRNSHHGQPLSLRCSSMVGPIPRCLRPFRGSICIP
ncbi:hypothetical protein HPB48_003002 [Haemaphysalis longicornis]|uniref:Uncharacterized protein n=1 Tax=Haemaphysalis longicornis TaxID=44386 RepID=A0A9J6FGQ0_HAELO|nr:hypothetical protein HPB48_003002 [Haemaphysalis longicornis]